MSIPTYVPLILLFGFAAAVAGGLVVLDHLLGPKRPNPTKAGPYECGLVPIGTARDRLHVRFFLIALLFILFDVEAVFLYLWVYLFKDRQTRFLSLIEVFVFLSLLVAALVYAWRKGALEWE
ncbi:MAG: NADH-quinone oxidoreductase subunit A [Candidatus Riflebacteria bacterium]|nr:NADH-quinone oxidoreductase subunit A [Candidatus Riflebacteria bacterium]